MKTIWLLLVLSACVSAANAQVTNKEVKLIGVTAGFDKNAAIIEVRTPRRSPEDVVLGEGQGMNGIQVVKIDAAKGTASVNVDGEARTLVIEEDPEHPSTNTIDGTSSTVIRCSSLSLSIAMDLYAYYKGRTIMRHPKLGGPTFSLNVNPQSKEEAAEIFEKMFNERDIATIPDGEHLVMIVPFSFTNAVNPRATALTSTNSLIPEGSVNLRSAPFDMILEMYADYVHKDIVNLKDRNVVAGGPAVTFTQTTPLSREELSYALQTQIEWRNIRLVPDGDKWKLERIRESH